MRNDHLMYSHQEKWIKLSKREIKHIFIYFLIMFIISLISFFILVHCLFNSQYVSFVLLLIFSFICGLLGSTFYYIRKLYKSCLYPMVDTERDSNTIFSLGAKIYFYFRPIMGATLSVFVILGVYGGFFFLQSKPEINTEKFYIFTALMTFIIGFSNGNIIVQLDKNKDKIPQIIKFDVDKK